MPSPAQNDDLGADEVRRHPTAGETQRQSIARHLTRKTSCDQIELQHPYLVDSAAYLGPPKDWLHLAQEWREFKSAIADGDEIWEFNTVTVHLGFTSGEEGFALLRRRIAASWFITSVVG